MVQGLTVSVAMFFMLVLVPGYLGAWSAGRLEEARKFFPETIYRGTMNFGICLFVLLVLPISSEGYGKELISVFGGQFELITPLKLTVWLSVFWGLASISGFLQFLLDMRMIRSAKVSYAWRKFWAGNQPIETTARSDMLWEVFLCYRIVKKRPFITVAVKNGDTSFAGEVLKASWGIKGGLLLAHVDEPRNVVWIPLTSIEIVTFLNPGIPEAIEMTRGSLNTDTKELLNLIHSGYGNELEQKWAKKL